MRRAVATLITLGVASAIGWPAAAWAGGEADAYTDPTGISASASSNGGGASASAGRGSTSAPICSYIALSPGDVVIANAMAKNGTGPRGGDGPGTWYWTICVINGISHATVVWGAQAPADPAALAQQALDRTPLPSPGIEMNPATGHDQLVNLATWLWVDPAGWGPRSANAAVPGVAVTVTAAPQRVIWDMGNGDEVVCAPGTPYDASRPAADQHTDCSYTYRHSSAGQPGEHYVVTATVEWGATWTVTGAPGGGNLGIVRRSSSVTIRVAEAEALNQ